MMNSRRIAQAALASAFAITSSAASAETVTNTLTSIATVADACDIVGVGVDFGITSVPLPAAGLSSTTPNTAIGNAATGNTGNPGAAADGTPDDTLALDAPGTTGTLINAALSSISTAAPGVYVACTSAPTAITVTSGAAGATPYTLPVNLGGTPSGNFGGKMVGVGGGAGSGNNMSYTLTFAGTATSTAITGLPAGLFLGAFTAIGTVPASQGGTIVPGYYSDVATAQVDF